MLELRNAFVREGSRTLLNDISLRLEQGSASFIIGPSGGGKSTLLRSLAGIQALSHGELWLAGNPVVISPRNAKVNGSSIWPQVTMVFQQLFLWPHLRVSQNLNCALNREPDQKKITDLAETLDFADLLSRYPNEVSVGQRQRIALARAVLAQPKFLLLDEITSAQDAQHIAGIADVLHRLIEANTAVAIVTHHIGFASELMRQHSTSSVVYLVQEGRILGKDKSLDPRSETDAVRSYLAAESRYSISGENQTYPSINNE